MKRTQTILITTVMLSIALTSVFAIDFENNNNSLTNSVPFAAEAAKGSTHSITMEAVAMPDGLYAYRMVSYNIDGGNELVGKAYTNKPSIPGPTIIMNEGDDAFVTLINNACDDTYVDGPGHPIDDLIYPDALPKYNENSLLGIHVHGVHYDITDDATYNRMNANGDSGAACGQPIEYHWVASPGTAGAWPYHDHTFSINEIGGEELGLFGTLLINPGNGKLNGFVDDNGQVSSVNIAEIEKEFVLWMVSSEVLGRSIFYGNEIDYSTSADYQGNYGWRETALWTNPNLVTTEGGKYRFHVLGLGEETHAFHLHGHRWTDDIHEKSTFEDVIDVKEITPLQRHTFIIEASANDDAELSDDNEEMWMYHCHFVDHMKQGMTGMMSVLPGSDDLPVIGAVFTLSDEPGLWMKTLDAGVADQLDNILVDLGVPIQARNGTGFPLGYISDALEAIDGKGTGFSNSEGRSLAVINKGETVLFGMKDSQTKHTITTLIYPANATRLGGNGILNSVDAILESDISHFDQQLGIRGTTLLVDKDMNPVGLDEPGLYVFVCKIHPYMFSAVVVDDPETNLYIGALGYEGEDPIPEVFPAFPLLDFSDNLVVITRSGTDVHFGEPETVFPTKTGPGSDLARSLLTTFFVITDPNNWRDYQDPTWNVSFPPVVITTNNEETALALGHNTDDLVDIVLALGLTNSTGAIPANHAGLDYDVKDAPNPGLIVPGTAGVGEVLVNTQFERTVGKNFDGTPFDKPGTITAINTETWTVDRKISLPEINMNHPHNMWTDAKNEVIYQTEWFGSEMAIIDRETGELIKEVYAGQSPSHVMTSPETGKIYVAGNGEDAVFEFDSETYEMTRQLSTGFRSHPHGHWISSNGQYVVTPDFIGLKASILDLENPENAASSSNVLFGPIATGMKGDTALFSDSEEAVIYTADFLGNSMTGLNIDGTIVDKINFLSGDYGLIGLPIQTPISPDDKWMVTALTLGGKIALIDVSGKDAVVEEIIPCDPGCHGVQWGAKSGGEGYYAYVSSKFSNVMLVIDPEVEEPEIPEDYIVGRIALYDRDADIDDPVIGYDGFGGQGVLAIPNVYTGWFEQSITACSVENACSEIVNDWLEEANLN